MRIVIEGIWGSLVDSLVDKIIKDQAIPYDRVRLSVPPPPFNGIRGWTYALTENMRTWREHEDHEGEVILFQHSVWSSYAFARSIIGDSQLEKDEIDLFREMTEGIAEVHSLPDLIFYCHTFPEAALQRLKDTDSICAQLTEQDLSNTSYSMVEWLDEMRGRGVKVIEFPPPYKADMETWNQYAINTLQKVFNNFGVIDGSTD